MVQEYTQADNSCFGFGGSPTRIRNTGNSFPNPRTKSGSGYLAFFAYRTFNSSRYPHEQWCAYQLEEFKLRKLVLSFTTCNSDNKSLVIQILDNYSVLPTCFQSKTIRIMVNIYISNGDHIQQCYLSHVGLKLLVQKLKVLCRAWPN